LEKPKAAKRQKVGKAPEPSGNFQEGTGEAKAKAAKAASGSPGRARTLARSTRRGRENERI